MKLKKKGAEYNSKWQKQNQPYTYIYNSMAHSIWQLWITMGKEKKAGL